MTKKFAAIEIQITLILMGGGYIAKERKEIESVTESGTEFEITLLFDKPKYLKTSNYPNVFKF